MSIYQFVSAKVESAHEIVQSTCTQAATILDEMKAATAPIQEGSWKGVCSDFFLEKLQLQLTEAEALAQELDQFKNVLGKIIEDTNAMILQAAAIGGGTSS